MKRQNIMRLALAATLAIGAFSPFGQARAAETTEEDLRKLAAAAVEGYSSPDALRLGIDVVDAQLPKTKIFWDMGIGAHEVIGDGGLLKSEGASNDRESSGGMAGMMLLHDRELVSVAVDLAKGKLTIPAGNTYDYFSGCWSKADKEVAGCYIPGSAAGITSITVVPYDTTGMPTLEALLAEAVKLDAYKTASATAESNTGFKSLIDMAKMVYDRGEKSLRDGLTALDKAPAKDATGQALLAAYSALDEKSTYEPLVMEYARAKAMSQSYDLADDESKADEEYLKFLMTQYEDLILAASEIQDGFVEKVAAEVVARAAAAEEAKKAAAKAPDTGFLAGEMTGTLAKVALGLIAFIATGAGVIVTAKRWIFSPLKRRK